MEHSYPHNILHIITRLDQGGSAENTLYIVVDLKKKGYHTVLIAGSTHDPDGWCASFVKENDVQIITIPELRRSINPWADIRAFYKLYRFMRTYPCELVHTHSSKAGILGRWAAWLAGVTYIVHTPHGHVFYGYYHRWISYAFFLLEKMTALITTHIIGLTRGEINDYIRFRLAPEKKFTVIHSGVMLDNFITCKPDFHAVKKSFGFKDKDRIVGAITRLEPVKGNRFLISAWEKVYAKHPDARLLIVGDGSERAMLEKLAEEKKISGTVVFAGMRRNLPALLAIMEFLVLPSINEGMGKVLIQAAAMKKPAIGSRVCGIPDVIIDEKTGLLVPPGNPDALAEAIIKLLDNPGQTHALGNNAFARVTEPVNGHPRFSREAMMYKLDILYKELV